MPDLDLDALAALAIAVPTPAAVRAFYDAWTEAAPALIAAARERDRLRAALEAAEYERDLYRAAVSVLVEDLGGEIAIPQRHLEEAAALDEVEYRPSDDEPSDGPDVTFRIIVHALATGARDDER